MSTLMPGVCRHCTCTEGAACSMCGDEPRFVDNSRLVCGNPQCMKAERERLARARAAVVAQRTAKPRPKYAGWGYGAVVQDLRRRRRRKERAA